MDDGIGAVQTTGAARRALVAVERFVLATRDSGYKDTSSAVAELVDNAAQAGARRVLIRVDEEDEGLRVRVEDDGEGMDAATLQQALCFGGSARFGDRAGLGRYGMGLPNSSLSQARRLEVFSWRGGRAPQRAHLDVDEVASGVQPGVDWPTVCPFPPLLGETRPPNGTLVVWRRCDRLELKRPSALARRLRAQLGRVFRELIWGGLALEVNGELVEAVDPLRLRCGDGRLFNAPLCFDVSVVGEAGEVVEGTVEARFVELPVERWHDLPVEEKRALGVTGGAVVSVLRAGREIDAGWLLMGNKRRENYDDWWRCELRFPPSLDELFGVTHTKQQIQPTQTLKELLCPELELVARSLNVRARRAHDAAQLRRRLAPTEALAARVEPRLPPMPPPTPEDRALAAALAAGRALPAPPRGGGLGYVLVPDATDEETGGAAAWTVARDEGRLIAALNPAHPLVREALAPTPREATLELMILAMARAEAAAPAPERPALADFRRRWSQGLAELMKERPDAR